MICLNCKTTFDTTNKNQIYCSANCRNVDKVRQWRIKNKKTCECGKAILPESSTCRKCQKRFIKNMTLQEATYLKHHRSSAFALIRARARVVAKKNNLDSCVVCGYKRHVEIGHIIPIKEYPLATMIDEINDAKNLVPLCPTHHWEFDNKFLSIKVIEIGKYEINDSGKT